MTQEQISEAWSRNSTLNDERETEIPERTFHRHREGAYDVFGVRIACDRRTGRYYIENPEALEGTAFTSVMFRQLALDNRLLDNRKLSARIIDEDMRGGEAWMPVVVEALDSNHRLKLRYLSQFSGQETEAEIEPLFLKRHKQRWYLIARRGASIMTTYALDRVCSAELLDSEFEFDPAVDPATYFSDVVGVNLDSDYECEKVVVRVKAPQRNYLDHLPLHSSQKCIRRTDTFSDYEFHLRAEYEFQRLLLAMAGDVEVLQPEWLRHQIFTLGKSLMTDNC